MSTIYRRKPEVVHAMFWDGSKEGYEQIKAWMSKFLPWGEKPYCPYWDKYDVPPPERTEKEMENLRLTTQEFNWRYRGIDFYAWNNNQNMYPDRWVIFYGSEQDSTAAFPIPHGTIIRDEEFREHYEPVIPE